MNLQKFGNALKYFKNNINNILYTLILMDIKMFLEITGEFFDLMYTGGFYDYQEINENHEKKEIQEA